MEILAHDKKKPKGKLEKALIRQLKTEFKEDAEQCFIIFNYLKQTQDGHIWESSWRPLVSVRWEGIYPNNIGFYKPTYLGKLLIKDLKENGNISTQ